MPGIEHYRRKDADGSLPLPPAKIASMLFSTLVEGGEESVLDHEQQRFGESPDFDASAFERHRFVYLAANVAVALTTAAEKNSTVAHVLTPFRDLVLRSMRDRWSASEDSADEAVQDASAAYAALVFTNPADDRGISFDWPQKWLSEIAIEEHNPITLFQIARTFREYHTHTINFLTSVLRGEQTTRVITTEAVYEGDGPVILGIPHEDILSCDVTRVATVLNGFLESRARAVRGRGRVTIIVEGYDDDPRDLYDTPEVRRYLAALDSAFPFWFYFADPNTDTLKLLALCVCRVVKVHGGSTPEKEGLKRFMVEHVLALNHLCDRFLLGEDVKVAATKESLRQLVPDEGA
jgi:hypothetical protein